MSRFSKLELEGEGPGAKDDAGERRNYLELAQQSMREGSYETALRYFSRVLAGDSKVEKAWQGQILCLIHMGEYQEAVAWADRALGIFPGSSDVLAAKAVAWGHAGDLDKAMGFSDSSLKKDDASAFVWWARGDVLMVTNPQTARFCFDKAAELGKNDWQLLFWIGRTYLSIGEAATAKTYLQRAERLDAENPVVWHHLGLAYKELGMFEEAEKAFEAVLQRHPGRDDARQALEQIRQRGAGRKLIDSLRGWLRGR